MLGPADILAGPVVRRADPTQVTIWMATTVQVELAASLRPVGAGAAWTGIGSTTTIHVCERLWVHLMVVAPLKGTFPTATLLEYSIATVDVDGAEDHSPFATIVADDDLAYPGYALPTLFLQAPGTALNALYASCRKPHDVNGGANDALADGDSLIFNNVAALSVRPAILCLGGDQIYADDVADETFDAMVSLAATLEGAHKETMPDGLAVPGRGARQRFVQVHGSFTSTEAKNHVVTFAEFAAMYGLAWNPRPWPKGVGGDVAGFVASLRKVRRLMANTPTYMIFDDHDVTDDWNLSLAWFEQVQASKVGGRIVANALLAFWLFQGWGNAPDRDAPMVPAMANAISERLEKPGAVALLLAQKSKLNLWEFFTPTYPFVYFLDTRTQRGHFDGFTRRQTRAPAYLKSVESWQSTLKMLQPLITRQGASLPVVIVAAAPIFGYGIIDSLQSAAGKFVGPYQFDEEGWAANRGHLQTFLFLCGDVDMVVLSGDVHYASTATARFDVFDGDFLRSVQAQFPSMPFPAKGSGSTPTYAHLYGCRFLQLTSSAAKNYAKKPLELVSRLGGGYAHVMDSKGGVLEGGWNSGRLELVKEDADGRSTTQAADVASVQPMCTILTKVNNSAQNSPYLPDHNIGLVTITGRKVENSFLVGGRRTSTHTWDFATTGPWNP